MNFLEHPANSAWDTGHESLRAVERRIHDGVRVRELVNRGRNYVHEIFTRFPWINVNENSTVVEIGPGVGYIMQAMMERTGCHRIIGLDMSPTMINTANQRISRDRLPADRYVFELYDGVTIPWENNSVDFVYSVACVQHIPKPFAYNLFLEMYRVLAPGGCAVVHMLSWKHLPAQQKTMPFDREIRNQIEGRSEHWHHFYGREELEAVFSVGVRPSRFELTIPDGAAWLGFAKHAG